MNQLAQLLIVGKVTPCTKNVWIQNQIVGARLVWIHNKGKLPGPIAASSYQPFPLPFALKQSDTLSVVQQAPGYQDSPPVNVPIDHPPSPAVLSKGHFPGPIFNCVNSVLLDGLFPDAVVQVRSMGKPIGSGNVRGDGRIEVPLTRAINPNDQLTAIQTVCGNIQGKSIAAPAVQKLPAKLPPPSLAQGYACDTSVSVSNFTPGATAKLTVAGKTVEQISVPLSYFNLSVPSLQPKQIVVLHESLPPGPGCGDVPKEQMAQMVVGDAAPAPKVMGPLCENQHYVKVGGLRSSGLVQLQVTQQNTQFAGASSDSYTFTTPPLPPNGSVVAGQNMLCGGQWAFSSMAKINPIALDPPTLLNPPNNTPAEMVRPQLQWQDLSVTCTKPTNFDIDLSKDPKFMANVIKFSGVISQMHVLQIKSNLAYSTQYYWRVMAKSKGPSSEWSDVSTFTTVPKPTDPNDPNSDADEQVERDRYFIEDCPGFGTKVVNQFGNHNEAYQKAVNAALSCYINPLEVDQNTKVLP